MQDSIARTSVALRADEGKSLLSFLVGRFTYQSAEKWVAHIETGRLLLNGNSCSGAETLREGDRISFTPEPYNEPPVNTSYAIIAEDDDFLFVDKPALLPCHPGGIYLFNTLWGLLRGSYPHASFVNRLDRETSGIVIVAKNPDAASFAGRAMSERAVEKEYIALVEGFFPGEIDASGFLEHDSGSPIRKKLRFVPEGPRTGRGTSCRTKFMPGKQFPDGVSLVQVRPLTGRTHQIRATLQSLGYPIVGDKLYGTDSTIFLRFIDDTMTDSDRASLRLDRQALHCSRIVLPKRTGGTYDISAGIAFGDWR